MIFLHRITVNLAPGRVRRERVNGREYLVAPLVLIVPGVLAGSRGSLLYPLEEVERTANKWEGMPLTIDHPYRPATGEPLSANSPGVLDRQGVGVVKRSRMSRGKLVADGWFDVERTRRIRPRVLRDLEAGRPVELSTGLYTRNDPARPGSTFNGRAYEYVARDYRPDHLAILSQDRGACSVADGCGANVANSTKPKRSRRPCSCLDCSTIRGSKMNDDDVLLLPTDSHPTHNAGDPLGRSDDKLMPVLPDRHTPTRGYRVGDRVKVDTLEGDFHQPVRRTLFGTVTSADEGGYGYVVVRFEGRGSSARVEAKYLRPAGEGTGTENRRHAGNVFRGEDPLPNPSGI